MSVSSNLKALVAARFGAENVTVRAKRGTAAGWLEVTVKHNLADFIEARELNEWIEAQAKAAGVTTYESYGRESVCVTPWWNGKGCAAACPVRIPADKAAAYEALIAQQGLRAVVHQNGMGEWYALFASRETAREFCNAQLAA